MKILFVILAGFCITVVVTDDSVAMESEVRHQKVLSHYPEDEEAQVVIRPFKNYHRGDKKRNFFHREREAREYVFDLPPGYEIEGSEPKYYEEEQVQVPKKQIPSIEREKENLKPEPSQYPGSSYLSHIKEQMSDGKLLGYSSFVEHFSENDDAEELKTAMKEGSLDDIRKLVPKSSVSVQMYHGGDEEERTVKSVPVPEKKQEISWNEIIQPTSWMPPQMYSSNDRKKILRKHRLHYLSQETKPSPIPEASKLSSNLYESSYQIIPAINYELSGAGKGEIEHGIEQDRQESQTNYENEPWKPLEDKTSQSVKPPESSKIYYEHYKYSKPAEENKHSQLGRIIADHKTKPEVHFKKPMRFKLQRSQVPALASGEDFNQRYAQTPPATPVIPIRYWSKPESKFKPEPPKRFAKLNKQTDSLQTEKPSKDNGNVFLTKQFQNDVSEYFKNGKSDFEWVPSTQIRYDTSAHASNPLPYQVKPENQQEHKPKKYRIYRPKQPKNIVILGPETDQSQKEFPVSASYKIDKNRKSDEHTP